MNDILRRIASVLTADSYDADEDIFPNDNVCEDFKDAVQDDLRRVQEWQDILDTKAKKAYGGLSARELYWRLMNVESNPDILPAARAFLQTRLKASLDLALSESRSKTPQPTSLAYALRNGYNSETLHAFMMDCYNRTMDKYHTYMIEWHDRIDKGEPMELVNSMFPDKTFARWWLIQNAPTKLVDGSWLQNALSADTSPGLRDFALPLYQTFTEELGEGVIEQNHIEVYNVCLESEGIKLPAADSKDFAYNATILDSAYERGVVQMALGQFAGSELFPEALGYNFGYEQLPLHLLVTTHEFKQLEIDHNYFLLHVTIDNAATGHAYMATKAVVDYLEWIREREGDEGVQSHWRRIMTGYYLSEANPLKPHLDSYRESHRERYRTPHTASASSTFREMLIQKAPYAHKIHPPAVMLGAQPLHYWMDPQHIEERVDELMDALAASRWVVPGKPGESAFLNDLCGFGGGMFGIFTKPERRVVEAWIEGLQSDGNHAESSTLLQCPVSNLPATNGSCPITGATRRSDSPTIASPEEQSDTQRAVVLDMLSLISRKRTLGSKKHGSLSLTHSSGKTRRIDSWFDDPAGFMNALRTSGYVTLPSSASHRNASVCPLTRLEASVAKGGNMGVWFTEKDREVVKRWVECGAPLLTEDRDEREGESQIIDEKTVATTTTTTGGGIVKRDSGVGLTASSEQQVEAAAKAAEWTRTETGMSRLSKTHVQSTSPTIRITLPSMSPFAIEPKVLYHILLQSEKYSVSRYLAESVLNDPSPLMKVVPRDMSISGASSRTTFMMLLPLLSVIMNGCPLDKISYPAFHATELGTALFRLRMRMVGYGDEIGVSPRNGGDVHNSVEAWSALELDTAPSLQAVMEHLIKHYDLDDCPLAHSLDFFPFLSRQGHVETIESLLPLSIYALSLSLHPISHLSALIATLRLLMREALDCLLSITPMDDVGRSIVGEVEGCRREMETIERVAGKENVEVNDGHTRSLWP
ncbi:hypothetical protein BC832DRAFT_348522 [Gaertneriomyces semiglobifer]|nr:hypothetical protein BC832DRAFT_348522 [Gaertneriomyces semiglobifer]